MAHRTRSKKSPFVKAAVLGIALVLALIFYSRVPDTIHRINQLLVQLDSGEETAVDTLMEAQKDSLRARYAGFWTYTGPGGASRPNVHIDDRIELKENGIIWRVLTETLTLPSGQDYRVRTIEHSYLVPFTGSATDSGSVDCQVAFIKRARTFDDDTCYEAVVHEVVSGFNSEKIELRESTVWQVRREGSRLVVEGLAYEPYGDRDLAAFFPPMAIDVVDDIDVRACGRNETKAALMRQAIGNDIAVVKDEERSAETVHRLIDEYYVPECLRPKLSELAGGGKLPVDSFAVKLEIGPDGKVTETVLSGGGLSFNESLKKTLAAEIGVWRFTAGAHTEATQTVKHTVVMNRGGTTSP